MAKIESKQNLKWWASRCNVKSDTCRNETVCIQIFQMDCFVALGVVRRQFVSIRFRPTPVIRPHQLPAPYLTLQELDTLGRRGSISAVDRHTKCGRPTFTFADTWLAASFTRRNWNVVRDIAFASSMWAALIRAVTAEVHNGRHDP